MGIETSCDETAAAVVEDGERILSNVVVSQIDIFAEYGGVIPEVAARSHLEVMMPVVDKALADASVSWDEIDAIAVTHAPGLLGSLLIGTLTARTLAILHDKPLYAVHHLKSHVYANWLDGGRATAAARTPQFPLLALVVSGGHTQILYMPAHNQFEIVGTTRDDAVGECFDKVAKILGLPYPGGPSIAKAAEGQFELCSGPRRSRPSPRGERANSRAAALRNAPSQSLNCLPGDPNRYQLPHPKIDGLDFSFSGLKTAVLRAVQKEVGVPISYPSHKLKELLSPEQVRDFAASFQKTAVEILLEKMQLALQQYPETQSVVVAGGVSANSLLREETEKLFCRERSGALAQVLLPPENFSVSSVYFPEPKLSGDNGAMVAAAAYYEIQAGVEPTDPYSLNIYPRISIEN